MSYYGYGPPVNNFNPMYSGYYGYGDRQAIGMGSFSGLPYERPMYGPTAAHHTYGGGMQGGMQGGYGGYGGYGGNGYGGMMGTQPRYGSGMWGGRYSSRYGGYGPRRQSCC
eukprot:gnl/TRDRNA2_/TRDRNA2_160591_c0_seq2.p2 gnl/TRDRNA2_/TRDRNA2_160591_c0~~gnl/TRDRNA2_/TRDRNA2_160591_c0_seq2.p2  ORF type:complete len:111 (+),score=10.15 gnl/TRDRNA2_/TRDRNA2_160591_c0_seq2:82-414(+)